MIHMHTPKWRIEHATDRVIYMVKDDIAYGQFTDRPYGYVYVRIDPETGADHAMGVAESLAQANDAQLGLRIAETLMPVEWKIKERAKKYGSESLVIPVGSSRSVPIAEYREFQRRMAPVFATKDQEYTQKRYR